eukprot:6054490-Pyramimonas_sp.AAC.1
MGKEQADASELIGKLANQRAYFGARSVLSAHMQLAEKARKVKASAAAQLDPEVERKHREDLKKAGVQYPPSQMTFMVRRALR